MKTPKRKTPLDIPTIPIDRIIGQINLNNGLHSQAVVGVLYCLLTDALDVLSGVQKGVENEIAGLDVLHDLSSQIYLGLTGEKPKPSHSVIESKPLSPIYKKGDPVSYRVKDQHGCSFINAIVDKDEDKMDDSEDNEDQIDLRTAESNTFISIPKACLTKVKTVWRDSHKPVKGGNK